VRVLIAEDDPVSRRILQATLAKWGYQVIVTTDGDEAWEALRHDGAPKLAILDWMMPGLDGVDVCRRVRSAGTHGPSYTYIILLTTKTQKEDMIEGMEAGADDYITKPFDSRELKVRLRAARRVLDLESQLLATQEALRHEALHDSLTGLWNRPAILEILQKEIARGRRQGTSVGVIVADIDHFKKINDTCGHKVGDTTLRKAAEIMQSKLRPYDTIGRYGGEEFLIVMPECGVATAAARAETIRARLAQTAITVPGRTVSLTVCLGVTATSDDDRNDTDSLIQAADAAMYCAKRAGRNRVEIATSAA